MKKNIYINLIILCLFCIIFSSACKPSAKSQLIGKWKINGKATVAKMNEETKRNFGGEKAAEQLLSEIRVEYKKDGTFLATNNETGRWSVSADDKMLLTTPKGKKEENVTITEISETQFVVSGVQSISSPVVYEKLKKR